jgi:hypothetical protein
MIDKVSNHAFRCAELELSPGTNVNVEKVKMAYHFPEEDFDITATLSLHTVSE